MADDNDNVLPMENLITKLPLDPGTVLDAARTKGFNHVVIIGETTDGQTYLASSSPDLVQVSWFLERAKHTVNKMADDFEEIDDGQ